MTRDQIIERLKAINSTVEHASKGTKLADERSSFLGGAICQLVFEIRQADLAEKLNAGTKNQT